MRKANVELSNTIARMGSSDACSGIVTDSGAVVLGGSLPSSQDIPSPTHARPEKFEGGELLISNLIDGQCDSPKNLSHTALAALEPSINIDAIIDELPHKPHLIPRKIAQRVE